VIPLIVLLFKAIKSHYDAVGRGLSVPPDWVPPRRRHGVVILAQDVDTGLVEAVAYARSTSPDKMVAVTVVGDAAEAERVEKRWLEEEVDAPLEIVRAPAGDFTTATLRFIDELERRWPDTTVTVLGHTRWASVGIISEANAHPLNHEEAGTDAGRVLGASAGGSLGSACRHAGRCDASAPAGTGSGASAAPRVMRSRADC